jgi:hypothetical protein
MEILMRPKKRAWRWVLALIIGITIATLWTLWRLWPHERLLPQRSARVAQHWDSDHNPIWISEHEVAYWDVPWPATAANPAKIIITDLRTGLTQSVPVPQRVNSSHAYTLISPNGRWVLCCDGTPNPSDKISAVELKTGRSMTWPVAGDCYHYGNGWLADSHRWLQWTTLPDGYLILHNIDHPQQNSHLAFADYKAERWKWPVVTSSDHLLFIDRTTSHGDPSYLAWNGLKIREYSLLPAIKRLRSLRVSSPPGVVLQWAEISPNGEQILWQCTQTYISPIAAWLHRWIHRVPAEPQQRYGLWASRIDGSGMHEIGHINLSSDSDRLDSIQWLPDSKRVGFVYKDSLYTAPVE